MPLGVVQILLAFNNYNESIYREIRLNNSFKDRLKEQGIHKRPVDTCHRDDGLTWGSGTRTVY